MIHVLNITGNGHPQERVPAFGISFPPGHYDTEIEVVVNTVWNEPMFGPPPDGPEEEEDFDE